MKKYLIIAVITISFSLQAQFIPVLELTQIKEEAKIHKLDVEVDITGNVAETTVDITFFNPNDRVMEGTIKFPLTANQEIVEFYLDVNGKMRKASVVEKEKGRVAYEATIRQNIDPGLIEKSIDNSFKARVFPIPAKGYKRAIFKVQEELQLVRGKYKYTLPLESNNTIPEFALKATNYGDQKPESPKSLEFVKWQDTYTLDFEQKDYKLDKVISFKIPQSSKKTWVQDSYFYSTMDVSELYRIKETREAPRPISVTVLWDISASFGKRDIDLEYQYLKKYLNGLNRRSKIEIIPFNIRSYKGKKFNAEDADKILTYLKSFNPDGGTSLDNLKLDQIKADRILMFTDGISTFDNNSDIKLPKTPVYTVSSSYYLNRSLLRYYSLNTGGEYIDLLSDKEITKRPKLISIKKNGVEEVYTDLEITGDQFSFTGKLTKGKGEVELKFLKADGVEVVKIIKVKDDNKKSGVDIIRLWATKKIESLDLLYDTNKDEITQIGKEFGIVTRNTSLIVLDRVEDYVNFDIEPPTELREEWDKLMAQKVKQQRKTVNNNLSEALNEMVALKSWWKRDFPKDRPQPPAPIKEALETAEEFGVAPESDRRVLESRVSSAPEAELLMDASEPERKKLADKNGGASDSITIEGWSPDVPYYKELANLKGEKLLKKYYEIRDDYKNRPSFFVDVATLFYEAGDKENALLIISNVIEMGIEEPELIRITVYLLEKFGYLKEALDISFKLIEIRAEEPQTYRDIATLSLLNNKYQQALDYYYKVLTGKWDQRFNGIKSVVLNEMNYLISNYEKKIDLDSVDERLIFEMPLGVRAVISWSSNNNDIDLWVKDPYGEDCGYSNKLTHTGGKLSSDFTGGYGPEEFSIKEPLYGAYTVDINFYSDNRMSVSGPVTVKVDIYKNYGKSVVKETIIRRLADVKERITIGSVNF